jgi:hypothetical protein
MRVSGDVRIITLGLPLQFLIHDLAWQGQSALLRKVEQTTRLTPELKSAGIYNTFRMTLAFWKDSMSCFRYPSWHLLTLN